MRLSKSGWVLAVLVMGGLGCEPPAGEADVSGGGPDVIPTTDIPAEPDTAPLADASVDAATDAADPACTTDADCVSADPCSKGKCGDDGACVYAAAADGTPCDDGDACTVGDACLSAACTGKPDPACTGCESNADCDDASFCAAPTCAGKGACEPRPEACPDLYDPVCGCDGQTYGNACEAAAAGQRVAAKGLCECPAIACAPGLSPTDSNGDGCADTCLAACETTCDCYDNPSLAFEGECPMKCLTCANYWACDAGACQQHCGPTPDDAQDCEGSSGCTSNADCSDAEYCAKKDGACGSKGECVAVPDACPLVAKPVCGCDNQTWSNACFAAAAGVNVAHEGACEAFCGGIAGVPCPDGQWCDPDPGYCDGADIGGSCVILSDGCTKEYKPECGCDGKTYGNACMRRAAQVAKDHDGPCGCAAIKCKVGTVATDTDDDGCPDACLPCPQIKCAAGFAATDTDGDGCFDSCEPASCATDTDCPEQQWCKKASCDAPAGKCTAKPAFCTDLYSPVCSCGGKTYSNACEAWAAGQNVASKGACKSVCGTILGIPCPKGQLCDYPAGTCNVSDNGGICVATPDACPDVWQPVCGCDGVTYGNDCERLLAGVARDHDGQCSCSLIIDCVPGYKPIDTDGDGCADTCEPMPCSADADCGPFGDLYCQKADADCAGKGVCAPAPQACTKEYKPVCGCDGATYSNACMAHAAGTNVAHAGACTAACGGKQGLQCPGSDQFCEYPTGTCDSVDQLGVCTAVPAGCALLYQPVCGCDGKTYGNDCLRQLAGVSAAHDGACGCLNNADCAADAYCKQAGCGQPGSCAARPTKCTKEYKPVCGCDGTTWGNACFAASAGVSVASLGACKPDVVGCTDNSECGAKAYCAKKSGDCQGKGECSARPDMCPLAYDPVCGCDGKTYDNACSAAAAGTSVAHAGTCDLVCGGIAGVSCPPGQWCDPDPGSCQVSDAQGTCVVKPQGCPDIWDPVCGCDGKTYGNDCDRQAAGVGANHPGACGCSPVFCKVGKPIDTDGDGCADSCLPCPQILCVEGTTPTDTDGDGCYDTCKKTPCQGNADCGEGLYCAKKGCAGTGVCSVKPQACTQQYDPVCGCDGKTWGNACSAAAAGVNVESEGACTQKCGGFMGLGCPKGFYCQMEAGLCGGADFFGTCVAVPAACPDVWAPVCACSGKTYGNQCELEAAGEQLDHEGTCGCLLVIDCMPGYVAVDTDDDGCADACEPKGCKSNAGCDVDWMYCQMDACGAGGVCAPRPEFCTEEYAPVCSCTGETFSNACHAAAAGHNVAAEGACVTKCGGLAGLTCAADEFCDYKPGTCGVKGAEGTCADVPAACTKVYQPVCGCDGQTYGNDCFRRQAGVSKASDGPCSCNENAHCKDGSFCSKTDCTGPGLCEPKPTACAKVYKPVCGCDQQTWPNACSAHVAGVSVSHEGACEPGVVYCTTNDDCVEQGVAGYCAKEPGSCAGKGICQSKPSGCDATEAPVCGCDGSTWSNACKAAAAGVNVAHPGGCAPTACEHHAHCGEGEYCEKDGCSGVGLCATMPAKCPLVYQPVCGCDGKTYGNACEAAAAGTNIAAEGACQPTSCKASTQCGPQEYCQQTTCGGGGTCAPKPTACPDVWAPVCGCSGKTFGNGCEAAAAGDSVAYKGECEPLASLCKSNADCKLAGQYCARESGDCTGYGACTDKPTACPKLYDPVCGCDGQTYSNACYAASAGASVAHEGPCEPPVSDCQTDADCGKGAFCQKKDGDCDGAGTCVKPPSLCPLYFAPVCSCAGETFGNGCEAAAAGQNVKHQGACESVPTGCGGNADCAPSEYCAKKAGDCAGKGICEMRPTGCPEVWDPVCGCDGTTFGNACEAAAAGVPVQYQGECKSVAICKSNAGCEADEYCQKKAGGCGGSGQCAPRPLACPDVWEPVCSCTGVTFSNACDAAASGQNVAKSGPCEAVACASNEDCNDPPTFAPTWCAKKAGDCGGTGSCENVPFACPEIYAPVCGCDGKTYENKCVAAAAMVNVSYEGKCQSGGACEGNGDCADEDWCAKKAGDCGGAGQCQVRPLACPDVWAPVCGCNAKTYGNTCEAAAAGVNVAYEGACKPDVMFCDGSASCPAKEYCHYEQGTCGGTGVCTATPDACYQIYEPVCGCNGKTYGNACEAAAAGVSVAHTGQCKCAPIICPVGSKPVDTNNDGCPDTCKKTCNVVIDCAAGYSPVDTDGDGCPDACKVKCGTPCDCYEANLDFGKPCGALCPTCDNFWSCSDAGYCEAGCGPVPADSAACEPCDPIKCPAPKVAKDTDGDGCADACVCKALPCPVGSQAVDTNGDGCPDQCKPKCSAEPACSKEQAAVDTDGDGCNDECVCAIAIDCMPGHVPADSNGDGCQDTCVCEVQVKCGPEQQSVDSDGDGCHDTCIPANCQTDAECQLSDYFCIKPWGSCGDADSWGKCVSKASTCVGEPGTGAVCGCSGKTYESECAAAKAGDNVAYPGACKAEPGCQSNKECAPKQYCNLPGCVAAAGGGTCEATPADCLQVYDPVCGCDGKTYSNDCTAAAAGVSIAHDGPCKGVDEF